MRRRALHHAAARAGRSAPSISLPEDEGRHPWAREEWWYLNCHLRGGDSKEYGMVLCIFTTHSMATLLDVGGERVVYKGVTSGEALEPRPEGLGVGYGASSWSWEPERGAYAIHFDDGTLVADLECRPVGRPMLVGGRGLVREGLLGISYYYARPSLEVKGEFALRGRATRAEGYGWVDRQWGNWDWRGLGGWEWFSVQLENGARVSALGTLHPVTRQVIERTVSVVEGDGEAELAPGATWRRTATWRSEETGHEYGARWSVECSGRFALSVEAAPPGQEVVAGLWEGGCRVSGSYGGKPASGRAFVEQSHGRVSGRKAKRLALLYLGAASALAGSRLPSRPSVLGRKLRVG